MSPTLAAFWSVWAIYLALRTFREQPRTTRIGYFLGSCLAGLTAYALME
jgi:hypothetical protein